MNTTTLAPWAQRIHDEADRHGLDSEPRQLAIQAYMERAADVHEDLVEALKEADPTGNLDIGSIRSLAHAALNQSTLLGHEKEQIAGLLQLFARFLRVQRAALAKVKP